MAARVHECDPSAKPCRVAATGKAYLRSYDGDFELSVIEEQGQGAATSRTGQVASRRSLTLITSCRVYACATPHLRQVTTGMGLQHSRLKQKFVIADDRGMSPQSARTSHRLPSAISESSTKSPFSIDHERSLMGTSKPMDRSVIPRRSSPTQLDWAVNTVRRQERSSKDLPVIRRALNESALNIVGENHQESDGLDVKTETRRREVEQRYLKKFHFSKKKNYWGEKEFKFEFLDTKLHGDDSRAHIASAIRKTAVHCATTLDFLEETKKRRATEGAPSLLRAFVLCGT